MEKMKENPNYYSILPATVRYCKDLSPQEKLLYSEITALTNVRGYCWATNNYFAELYGLNKKSVSRQINNLAEQGFISIQLIYFENSKQVQERRIYLSTPDIHDKITDINDTSDTPMDKIVDRGIHKNADTPMDKIVDRGIHKNAEENTTSKNTIKSNIINNNNKTLKGKVCSKSMSSHSQEKKSKNKPIDNLTIDNEPVINQNANKTTKATKQDNPTNNPPVYDYDTYKEIIHKNISYSFLKQNSNFGDLKLTDELVECMLDVITTPKKTIKINSEIKDRQVVINKYLSLHVSDIQHVIMKFKEQNGKILHVSSYLKTLLYTVKQESNFFYENHFREQGLML